MSCNWCHMPAQNRCSKCKVVLYCCRDHQMQDFEDGHKGFCKDYSKALTRMNKEETILHNTPEDDVWNPGDPFVDNVGRFWGVMETRSYMRARYGVVEVLENIGSRESLLTAVNHILDMCRLCRSDNMGLRDRVPSMMIRIDQDQECYDFMKWWLTCDPNGQYDWGDVSLPHLNIHGANVLEDVLPEMMQKYPPSLQTCATMTLIKFRVLTTVKNLKIAVESSEPLVFTPVIPSVDFVMQQGGFDALIAKLTSQVEKLLSVGDKCNKRLWPALVNPTPLMNLPLPEHYGHGSMEEVQIALNNMLPAWQMSQGALDMLEVRTGADPRYDTTPSRH